MSLGGAGDKINLVPMDKVLNNGTWKTMEANLAKALEQGKSVSVSRPTVPTYFLV
ncbi:MAG: DNA/RNA non-specific endonuclease [Sulfurovaceae bacterium]|nr:DNA/RNA non-specific endonuclease [Sulfurovaceae bacterium]